jgi:hypothetical protein
MANAVFFWVMTRSLAQPQSEQAQTRSAHGRTTPSSARGLDFIFDGTLIFSIL